MPFGLLKGLIQLANDRARDIDNKRRFAESTIDKSCLITPDTQIGYRSRILSGAIINHSHIGSYTYCNYNALIQHAVIGNYCSISHNVVIGLGSHPISLFSTSPLFYKVKNAFKTQIVDKDYQFDEYKEINIGSDVWIGANAIIMDGINVGHGAVVAAGAIVTKDVPPFAIVGGVPAKILKYRFSEGIRDQLIETAWWMKAPIDVQNWRGHLEQIISEPISNK